MNTLSASVQADIFEQAVARITDLMVDMMERLVQDGVVYGDHIEDDQEFVSRFLYLRDIGALNHLKVINPKLCDEMIERFRRITSKHITSGAPYA